MLPSEAHLIEEFQCSRNTVRRAIQQLNQEGLVQSINGKGVVVLEQIPETDKYTFYLQQYYGNEGNTKKQRKPLCLPESSSLKRFLSQKS